MNIYKKMSNLTLSSFTNLSMSKFYLKRIENIQLAPFIMILYDWNVSSLCLLTKCKVIIRITIQVLKTWA